MRRLIFAVLHDRGRFQLSRTFRLQGIGDLRWLLRQYNLPEVSRGLDELMVLDVTRGVRDHGAFVETVGRIASECFIPVTAGGGITSMGEAHALLRGGADKLLLNSAFDSDPALCAALAAQFGRQCIVAGIDVRRHGAAHDVVVAQGTRVVSDDLPTWVSHVQAHGAGELLFQSVERDGSGMGLDTSILDLLPSAPTAPCLLMGGAGHAGHIVEALRHPRVDGVATANLLNFIGDALLETRRSVAAAGIAVAHWGADDARALRHCLGAGA
jgi:cyclase